MSGRVTKCEHFFYRWVR